MAAPPNPQVFLGPMLIGVFLNLILYGLLIAQAYKYFQVYKRGDQWWKLALVIYLIVLETFNSVTLMYMMYDTFINKILAGPPTGPPGPPMFLSADAVITVLISTPVQFCLAWRVYRLSGITIFAIVICLLGLISLGGGIAMTVLVTIFPEFSQFKKFVPAATTWLMSSALADILIAGGLIVTLYRRRTGMAKTNDVLNKIILFTVETGFLTAAFAIANVVLFLVFPDAAFNFIPDFALSKLYTNTFLASLNARAERSSEFNKSEVIVHVSGADPHGSMRLGSKEMGKRTPGGHTDTATSSLYFATSGAGPKREARWDERSSWGSMDEESGPRD